MSDCIMPAPSGHLAGVLLLALLVCGCTSTRTAVVGGEAPPHPLAGEWVYSLDTPQGSYTGSITFSVEGDSLVGAIAMDMAPDDPLTFGATYDSETAEVTFTFDSGEYGLMDVALTLVDDTLTGQQYVRDYSMHLDVTATRKEEAPAQ